MAVVNCLQSFDLNRTVNAACSVKRVGSYNCRPREQLFLCHESLCFSYRKWNGRSNIGEEIYSQFLWRVIYVEETAIKKQNVGK